MTRTPARSQRQRAVCGLLLGILGVAGLVELTAQDKKAPAVPAVAAAPTSTAVVELKPARLLFVDRHEVAFDHPGVLQFVVEEAEVIKAGQVVARLEDGIAKAALAVSEARVMNNAEVISAQKQAELAQLKSQAAEKANAEHQAKATTTPAAPQTGAEPTPVSDPASNSLYPKVYLDELRLTAEAAQADIGRFEKEHAVAQKGRDQAQAELNALELKAPRDGLVTRAFKQTGEGTQSGEKVLEIISTQRVRVEVEVPAVTAARLKVGMPATVLVHQPTGVNAMDVERYPVVLKFIDPTIGQVSQKVRIFAEIDNSHGKLREGLTASIEVIPEATPAATKPQ